MRKNNKRISITAMLIMGTLLLSIVPVIVVSITSIITSSRNSKSQLNESFEMLANIGGRVINTELQYYKDILNSEANNQDFANIIDNEQQINLQNRFEMFMDSDDVIHNIYYCDINGQTIMGSKDEIPEGMDITQQAWFQETMNSEKEYVLIDPYEDAISKNTIISIYKKVINNGETIGILGIDINLAVLSESVEDIKQGDNGHIIVSDSEGNVIVSSDENLLLTNEPAQYDKWDYIRDNNEGSIFLERDNIKYRVYFRTNEDSGWKTLMKIPLSQINETRNKTILYNGILAVICIAISALIVTICSLKVAKLIVEVKDALDKAADCNFNFSFTSSGSSSEFKGVEESFNTMQSNISNLIRKVTESINAIDTSTEDSVTMGENIYTSMNDINETINQIAAGTMQSSEDLEKISYDMDVLSDNMDDIKKIVENITDKALNASKMGAEGVNISNIVIDKSKSTKESTNSVNGVIINVADSLKEIESMNEAIGAITEQTNLLALNASIEAARAGEAGKGFAVVADEIKQLAEETSLSAKQINEIIINIRNNTDIAVEKARHTSATVMEQEEAVVKSQETFEKIINSINELALGIEEILNNVSHANDRKDNVLGEVSKLSATLEETAAGSEEVAHLSEEVKKSASINKEKVEQLRDVSKSLEEQIKIFKI